MARNPVPEKWTVTDYLEYEVESGIRHEYIDGEIFAMSGGTDKHSLIIANINGSLWQSAKETDCRVYSTDMRVKVSETKYLYSDLSIVFGTAQFDDDNHTMLTNPTVVIEVTSDTSESYDKGIKAEFYRSIESLQAYLVIDQDRIQAQIFTREPDSWRFQQYNDIQQIILLPDLELPLSDVYFDIRFDDSAN